ncbi:MAG: sensor histidine kinase [Bacteroidota bacterium]|nr:sensor histidine kinase [Candidatus Kapabacteria bacterium]MDW8219398.1 sensor histidine kinase [Bacteroidota bacterium]
MMRFYIVLCLECLLLSLATPVLLSAYSQPQELTQESLAGTLLGTQVAILEDTSASLSVQHISALPPEQWKHSRNAILSFGFTSSAYWVRLHVVNPNPHPLDWLLEIGYPMIDSIALYTPESGTYTCKTAGDHFPFYYRDIDYRHCVLSLTEKPSAERVYYLRFRTTSSMNIPLIAWSPSAFTQHLSREQMIIGLYYGAMIVMLLYNLSLFIGIRDVNYLYYVLFIAGQIMYQFTLNGLSFQYLWSDAIWWGNICLPLFIGFATFWAVFFARSFLSSKENAPFFDYLYRILLVATALSVVVALFFPYSVSIRMTTVLAMVSAPTLAVNSGLEWRSGFQPAQYFFISWLAFITGVVLYALKTFGVLPSTSFTNLTVQIGSIAQVVLLSLALVGKYNVMKRDYYRAQQDLIKAQLAAYEAESAKKEAEIYRLRNIELAQAYRDMEEQRVETELLNRTLRQLNEEKNEFLGIVAHDLKNPLSNISMLAKVLHNESHTLSADEVREFAHDIQTTSERMFELITNLLDINAIENKAVRLTPIPFDVTEVAQHVASDYRGRAEAKQISINFEIPPENTMVFADKSSTVQILDNLISNAIKYSPLGRHIYIRLRKQENTVLVEVQDEGQGLTDEDKRKLFGKFARLSAQPTGGEHSTGLGLSIAKKLALAMNGDIWCESEFGKGAKFILKLPAMSAAYENIPNADSSCTPT